MAQESSAVEANRLIKEFEKRSKEAEHSSAPFTKTTRLIEKFEKKSQGIDDRISTGSSVKISNIKKVFEPSSAGGDVGDESSASSVIAAGSTNKLKERFQPGAGDQS